MNLHYNNYKKISCCKYHVAKLFVKIEMIHKCKWVHVYNFYNINTKRVPNEEHHGVCIIRCVCFRNRLHRSKGVAVCTYRTFNIWSANPDKWSLPISNPAFIIILLLCCAQRGDVPAGQRQRQQGYTFNNYFSTDLGHLSHGLDFMHFMDFINIIYIINIWTFVLLDNSELPLWFKKNEWLLWCVLLKE